MEKCMKMLMCQILEKRQKKIMALPVGNYCKVLLLLGIGCFPTHNNRDYVEIIKQLAEEQRLFIIIASSDYIYGTNYQFFCPGFRKRFTRIDTTEDNSSYGKSRTK